MKKLFFFFLLVCYQVSVFAIPKVESPYIYFYHLDRGEVLYEQDSKEEIAVASLTKIMTSLVALDLITDLDAEVILTSKDFKGLKEANASVAGFFVGEKVTYRDLLYGLLLPSGADAALALANHLVGSEDAFVDKMNEKAKNLNLEHTHFINTTGLDSDGHYSSVEDIAIILKEALKNQEFEKIFTTKKYVTSNSRHTFKSTLSKTATTYKLDVSYILGSKAGYTYDAGLCLASIAKHNGETYLLVTANADYKAHKPYHIMDADKLYKFFFENYEYKTLLEKGQKLKTIIDANELEHDFFSNKEIIRYLPKNSVIDYQYNGLELIDYDIEKGSKIGEYQVLVDNELVDKQEFFLDEKIIRPKTFPWLWVGIGVGIFLLLIIILITINRRKKRMRKKEEI